MYTVINSWDGKCVCFGNRIYLTVVRSHAKCPIRFWYKNTRRTTFALARFYKVIVQQILNFFPEILLFYRVHSVWMLLHRFCFIFAPGVGRNTFLSSPHLCFIIVFICDLFVSRDDPLMS